MTEESKRADEELSRYKQAQRDIAYNQEKIDRLQTKINRTNRQPREIDIQVNSDPKSVEELLATMADMITYYDQLRCEAERLCFVLELSIRERTEGVYARVLSSFYLHSKRLEQIALEEDYCYPQIKRLRWRALEMYGSKMIPNDP